MDSALLVQSVLVYVLYRTVHRIRRMLVRADEARAEYIKHYMHRQLHEATRDDARLRRCCKGFGAQRRAAEEDPQAARRVRQRTDG